MAKKNVLVIGASAGGIEALSDLVARLPADFEASVLVVVHIPKTGTSVLPRILSRRGNLPATHARDGARFEKRHIYVGPPNFHLELTKSRMRLVSGPLEHGLQSTNEELGYINEELRRRGAMVDDLNSFLRALFASLGGGVAVVDRDLRVKVWNHMAEDLWGLRAEEVVGRPLTDLDIGLPLREVLPLIAKSFKDGKKPQGEVGVAAVDRRGKKIACRVTVNPLVEPDQKRTRGVILTMEEGGRDRLARSPEKNEAR